MGRRSTATAEQASALSCDAAHTPPRFLGTASPVVHSRDRDALRRGGAGRGWEAGLTAESLTFQTSCSERVSGVLGRNLLTGLSFVFFFSECGGGNPEHRAG